jgi:hypothetical protein
LRPTKQTSITTIAILVINAQGPWLSDSFTLDSFRSPFGPENIQTRHAMMDTNDFDFAQKEPGIVVKREANNSSGAAQVSPSCSCSVPALRLFPEPVRCAGAATALYPVYNTLHPSIVMQVVAVAGSARRGSSYEEFECSGPSDCFVARPGSADEYEEMVSMGVLREDNKAPCVRMQSRSK